jgi:phosphoglucomutase
MANGDSFTIRPSGTEPKIKFYISVQEETDKEKLSMVKEKLKGKIQGIMDDIYTLIDSVQ